MRAPSRSPVLLLAGMLAFPAGAPAQQPAGSPPAAAVTGLAGSWEGWAKLSNDWPGLACRYDGGAGATSVRLELSGEQATLHGSVAIDLPAVEASGCPPLRKRYVIREVSLGAGTAAFTDSGGNEWTLSVRRSGSVLQGMLAWQQGGTPEPLAEGFTRPDGVRPMTRLSGEVRVVRSGVSEQGEGGGAAAGAAPAAQPATTAKVSTGSRVGQVVAIIGANVVGLGALYGANKLGKGSSSTGTITCSPRSCIVGAPNAPCFCESNSNLVSNASCGSTPAGQPLNAPCNVPDQPCQSSLSCNSNVCEDKFGHCPY
jgi:hypothetical protein